MKKIKIEINQAKIISFTVDMEEKYPELTATIGLFSGTKKISTFSLSTKSWQDLTFDLPIHLIDDIKNIADELETILILRCSQSIGRLASGKK